MSNTAILWTIIWICFTVTAVMCKDSSVMVLPSLGMLIWYLSKVL